LSSWKRGFLEIIGEILDKLIENPLIKTHITFKCNLDSRAVTKYLAVMKYVGLVEQSKNDSTLYVITQKGIHYRNQFHSIISIMERDLESFQMKSYAPKEIIANLKTKR
jgi:predicted transcriptional regulator